MNYTKIDCALFWFTNHIVSGRASVIYSFSVVEIIQSLFQVITTTLAPSQTHKSLSGTSDVLWSKSSLPPRTCHLSRPLVLQDEHSDGSLFDYPSSPSIHKTLSRPSSFNSGHPLEPGQGKPIQFLLADECYWGIFSHRTIIRQRILPCWSRKFLNFLTESILSPKLKFKTPVLRSEQCLIINRTVAVNESPSSLTVSSIRYQRILVNNSRYPFLLHQSFHKPPSPAISMINNNHHLHAFNVWRWMPSF